MDAAVSEVTDIVREYEDADDGWATTIMLTNYAYHYGVQTEEPLAHDQVSIGIVRGRLPFGHQETWNRVAGAMRSYGRLPSEWREFD